MVLFVVSILLFLFFIPSLLCLCFSLIKQRIMKVKHETQNLDGKEDTRSLTRKIKEFMNEFGIGLSLYYINFIGKWPGHLFRNFFYKYIFKMNINKNVVIYGGGEFRAPYNIEIGKGTIIGDRVRLDGRNGIKIGENVNISSEVSVWTEQHSVNDPYFRCLPIKGKSKRVQIGNRTWISCGVIVLPGVKIGEGSVIAAGAVVTSDVEPYSVYAGIPARKIAERNKELKYEFNGSHLWFY